MRLIDADALLEAICEPDILKVAHCIHLVRNAPTVQREGWVSVPIEPTEEMLNAMNGIGGAYPEDGAKIWETMIQAAPKE